MYVTARARGSSRVNNTICNVVKGNPFPAYEGACYDKVGHSVRHTHTHTRARARDILPSSDRFVPSFEGNKAVNGQKRMWVRGVMKFSNDIKKKNGV